MFSVSILTLSLLSLLKATQAAQTPVSLVVDAESSEIDTFGLGSLHEGAGINYFFIGTTANSQALTYDDSTKQITSDIFGSYPSWVGFTDYNQILQLSVLGNYDLFSFDDESYLLINGSVAELWACKNINDPYRYSQSSYAISKSKLNSDCLPLKLKNGSGGSSSVSSSVTVSSSTAHSSSVSESFSGYNSTSFITSTKSTSSSKPSVTPSVTEQVNGADAIIYKSVGLTSLLSFVAMLFF